MFKHESQFTKCSNNDYKIDVLVSSLQESFDLNNYSYFLQQGLKPIGVY